MKRSIAAVVGAVALAAALAGCGGRDAREGAPAAPSTVGAVAAPAPVPAPVGKPVLTLKGAVSNRNDGAAVVFDLPTLDAMATATTQTHEPFVIPEGAGPVKSFDEGSCA